MRGITPDPEPETLAQRQRLAQDQKIREAGAAFCHVNYEPNGEECYSLAPPQMRVELTNGTTFERTVYCLFHGHLDLTERHRESCTIRECGPDCKVPPPERPTP